MAEAEDGHILGYAGLHVIVDEGYIDNIAVEPDARRHGVASALLDVYCRFGAVNLAFLTLEDLTGTIEIIVFPKDYENNRSMLEEEKRVFIRGRVTLIGCPKLDTADYEEKLTAILTENDVRSVMLTRMEVPCCGGLEYAARQAIAHSGRALPLRVVTISAEGRILQEQTT